ncbi:DUF779 domain-containing protein [Nocardia caishijiensis]|uniref:Uncharacterized protein (DUF779 family) n=1 Tax=Nocardia caishijiensis TaxID=184756 RepID=A0ABQ6YLS7_9NOCA|nr:DUF779 domain-containing protein [Nocardia caishijiensis]KAF0846728.1 uncharacterized protein (DUF779 family) [Nocardia caishijiensis]
MGNRAGSVHRDRDLHARWGSHRHRAIEATGEASDVLALLTEMHGPVVLYLAPGTDGRSPICVRRGEFCPSADDVLAGRTAAHTEFWMAGDFYAGFEDLDVGIEVRSAVRTGRQSGSLESDCGFRFTLRISTPDAAELVDEAS